MATKGHFPCTVQPVTSLARISLQTVSAIALLWGCGNSSSKDEGQESNSGPIQPGSEQGKQTASKPIPADEGPIDPAFVPLDALNELMGISLESSPPCTETLSTMRPLMSTISKSIEALNKAGNLQDTGTILSTLSEQMSLLTKKVPPRSESEELRRTSAEVIATMTDMAESLELLSKATLSKDKPGAGAAMRRLHNGVANARSAIEGLANQCAQ